MDYLRQWQASTSPLRLASEDVVDRPSEKPDDNGPLMECAGECSGGEDTDGTADQSTLVLHGQDELVQTLRPHLPVLRERYAVRSLALFGSYVRGQARPRSDLDALVEFDETPSLCQFGELRRRPGGPPANDRKSEHHARRLTIQYD